MNIFFDLDGTLIDAKSRMFELFKYLVPDTKLDYLEYWKLKQQKTNHETILKEQYGYSHMKFQQFESDWMGLIESKEWLEHDQPFEGVTEYLDSLKKRKIKLFLVTARQGKEMVMWQLKKFNWSHYFNKVLVTEQKTTKEQLIQEWYNLESINWIVGDTGKDIQVGKDLNINTAAVLSGFLNYEVLSSYQPDVIVDSVTHLSF